MSQLAIQGGPKAIKVDASEQWQRPVEEEKQAVCELIQEGFLSGSGKGLPKQFEEEFAEFIGCKYVLTLSHGHLALASAYFAAGVNAGDEFIHPALGYVGSYAGALHMGATPVFCETDPETLLADAADIEKRITDRTRAVSPVHWHGRVCDMDALLPMCDKHSIVLIEDAAHAHGSSWDGKRIGSFGHIACFSMQGISPGGKPVHAGEGGILATNDRELYERALIYAHLHRGGALDELTNPVYQELDFQLMGWKWRAHPFALAVARISLANLPYRMEHFTANREAFFEAIRDIPGVRPARNFDKARGAELYDGLMFTYDPDALHGLPVELFCEALEAEGARCGANLFRSPEHLRSLFTKELPGLWGKGHPGPANNPLPRYRKGDFPRSEYIHEGRSFGMPGWIEAADGAIGQTADAIRKVVDRHEALLESATV